MNDYGLKPMGIKEEFNAPENIRKTRNCKVSIINDCVFLTRYAEQMIEYVRRIPEEDDDRHAALVETLRNRVHSALIAMDEAQRVGRL